MKIGVIAFDRLNRNICHVSQRFNHRTEIRCESVGVVECSESSSVGPREAENHLA